MEGRTSVAHQLRQEEGNLYMLSDREARSVSSNETKRVFEQKLEGLYIAASLGNLAAIGVLGEIARLLLQDYSQ